MVSFGFSKEVSRFLNVFEISSLLTGDSTLGIFSFNVLYLILNVSNVLISFCPSDICRISSDSFKISEQLLRDSLTFSSSY